MTEYIEREAVLRETYKAQDELESNDDKVWRRNKPYFKGLAWANRIILDTPAADVVKVIRCMDCIHFKTNISKENYCDIHSTTWDKFYVRDDDFCSYGERKEGADNGKD